MNITWNTGHKRRGKAKKNKAEVIIFPSKKFGEYYGVTIGLRHHCERKILENPDVDRLMIGKSIDHKRLYFKSDSKGRKISNPNGKYDSTLIVLYNNEFGTSLINYCGEYNLEFDEENGLYYINLIEKKTRAKT